MKSKVLVRQLRKFAQVEKEGEALSSEDFDRCLKLIFRYLASMSSDECVDTFNEMIKKGASLNKIEGKLKEKMGKKGSSLFAWTRPLDYLWQETARIFSPSWSRF